MDGNLWMHLCYEHRSAVLIQQKTLFNRSSHECFESFPLRVLHVRDVTKAVQLFFSREEGKPNRIRLGIWFTSFYCTNKLDLEITFLEQWQQWGRSHRWQQLCSVDEVSGGGKSYYFGTSYLGNRYFFGSWECVQTSGKRIAYSSLCSDRGQWKTWKQRNNYPMWYLVLGYNAI